MLLCSDTIRRAEPLTTTTRRQWQVVARLREQSKDRIFSLCRRQGPLCRFRPRSLSRASSTFNNAPALWAATRYKILHHFGASGDGSLPYGSLARDDKGNVYGVTISGGT